MSVTVKDIARYVGCSPSTVSRALNNTAIVDPKLRRRILVAARALEATSASSDRPRRGRPRGALGRAGTIEIIVFRREAVEPLVLSASSLQIEPLTETATNLFFSARFRLVTDFYRHVINGMVSVLAAHGLKSVQQVRNDLTDPDLLREVGSPRLCGVLLMGEPDPQVESFACACACPVVLVDILGVSGPPVVAIDNIGGTLLALRHLLELGHRRIGFIGNPDNPSFHERFLAYSAGLAEAGSAVRPEWHYRGACHIRDIAEGLQPILRAKHRPTAMLCACDHYAVGAYEAARMAGLRIPQDISITGFDDVDAAHLMSPPLTTLRVPKIQLGACAADLLLRLAPGNRAPDILRQCEIRCRTELIVRDSAGPCPSDLSARRNRRRVAKAPQPDGRA